MRQQAGSPAGEAAGYDAAPPRFPTCTDELGTDRAAVRTGAWLTLAAGGLLGVLVPAYLILVNGRNAAALCSTAPGIEGGYDVRLNGFAVECRGVGGAWITATDPSTIGFSALGLGGLLVILAAVRLWRSRSGGAQ